MKINFKKIFVGILLILCAIVVYKIPRLLINKNIEPLPEVKLKETNDVKSFAIMIQNENGYEEYNKDTWPTTGYKFKEAKCIDNNGSKVDNALTYDNGKVTLETNQTVYCTLYFDKKLGISALDIVASKPKSLSPNPDQGDMYRYQGTSDLVNDNYICFGTKEKSECTTDEDYYMYRILGITPKGEIKLIKETPIVEEGNTVFSWFKATGTNEQGTPLYGTKENGLETWPESLIYKRLNGLSNGTITGSGMPSSAYNVNDNINANTDIFVDSSEYEYLKSGDSINGTKDEKGSEWYQLIANHDWMYGDTTEQIYDGHKMYQIENGLIETKYSYFDENKSVKNGTYFWNKETDKVTSKIGLPYLHDFYFGYYDGFTKETRGIPGNYSLGGSNNWMLSKDGNMFPIASMMRCSVSLNGSYFPNGTAGMIRSFSSSGEDGSCNGQCLYDLYQGYRYFPTFYLPNTIEMEGTGIETDPYRIVN